MDAGLLIACIAVVAVWAFLTYGLMHLGKRYGVDWERVISTLLVVISIAWCIAAVVQAVAGQMLVAARFATFGFAFLGPGMALQARRRSAELAPEGRRRS